jgi:hypothetical protein
MKTIGRIAILLLAALLVVGAVLGLEATGVIQVSGSGRGEPPAAITESGDEQADAGFQRGNGGARGNRGVGHDHHEGNAGAGLLKNLIIVAAIVAGVSLVERLLQQRKPKPAFEQAS